MSDPSTPSTPSAGATRVTPSEKAGEASVPLVHFISEILDLFVDILDEEETNRDKLKQGVNHLLTEHWRVRKWGDMKFFRGRQSSFGFRERNARGAPSSGHCQDGGLHSRRRQDWNFDTRFDVGRHNGSSCCLYSEAICFWYTVGFSLLCEKDRLLRSTIRRICKNWRSSLDSMKTTLRGRMQR
jgi:hypothetical protein